MLTLAHFGQHGAIDPLHAEEVGVENFDQFLRRERLGRTDDEMADIVHDYVDVALFRNDRRNGGVRRGLGHHVEFERAQIVSIAFGSGSHR